MTVTVSLAGDQLEVVIGGTDAVLAFKRRLVVPLRSVREVRVTDEVRAWLSGRYKHLGFALPGTNVPLLLTAGSFRRRGHWTFYCLHRRQKALVVDLDAGRQRYERLVLGVPEPQHTGDAIQEALSHGEH